MARFGNLVAGVAAAMVLLAPLDRAAAQPVEVEEEEATGTPEAAPPRAERPGRAMMDRPERADRMEGMRERRAEMAGERPGSMAERRGMPRGYGMGHGGMGSGGMGHGGMGHGGGHPMMGGMMMRMMFALMDADGDGSVSREEWLDAHERIFNHLDREGDGEVTLEDMRAFMTGRGFGTSPLGAEADEDEEETED